MKESLVVVKGPLPGDMVHLAQWLSQFRPCWFARIPGRRICEERGTEMGRFGCGEISPLMDLHMYLVAGRR